MFIFTLNMDIIYSNNNISIKYKINTSGKINGIYKSKSYHNHSKIHNLVEANKFLNPLNHFILKAKFNNGKLLEYRYKDVLKFKIIKPEYHLVINVISRVIIYNEYNNGVITKIIYIELPFEYYLDIMNNNNNKHLIEQGGLNSFMNLTGYMVGMVKEFFSHNGISGIFMNLTGKITKDTAKENLNPNKILNTFMNSMNKMNGDKMEEYLNSDRIFNMCMSLIKDISNGNVERYKKYKSFKYAIILLKNNKIHGECRLLYHINFYNTDKCDIDVISQFKNGIIENKTYLKNVGKINDCSFNLLKIKKNIIPDPLIIPYKYSKKIGILSHIYLLDIKMFYKDDYFDVIIKTI